MGCGAVSRWSSRRQGAIGVAALGPRLVMPKDEGITHISRLVLHDQIGCGGALD